MASSASPAGDRQLVFDAFRMDVAGHRLWRGEREIPLRPKSWDVLRYLLGRPGLLVTKEALHREIWPDTAVSDDTLTKSIGELRRALGDTSRTPRLIETVHGRGFRFVAEVRDLGGKKEGPSVGVDIQPLTTASRRAEPDLPFVGRQTELEQLHECLRRAGQGERQLVFITGEAGIGKTTLAEEFLRSSSARDPDLCVLQGRCIQQHGEREAYMPVLEALERLLHSTVGSTLIPLFRRMAPCWHAQIPWLSSEGEPGGLPGALATPPPERMLREIGALLEAWASRSTIVLVLEDLHWSDNATAALLSFLAERRDPARLLIIGTFRPAEASTHDHPIRKIKQTLRARRRCVDLALDYLSAADVRAYLLSRFGDAAQHLAPLIHRRTDGNPLFVVAIVEDLIRRGQLALTDGRWVMAVTADRLDLALPEELLELVIAQLQSLGADERAVLEAASVAGVTFATRIVARALGRDAEDVEAVSQHLARAHLFVTLAGRAENGGLATHYDFTHALHHQAIYEEIPPLRRQRLHLTIAEALESTSGERLAEIAPELSVHFERGGDLLRAAKYLSMCTTRAQQRQASHEAIGCAELALGLLERAPDTPQRRQRELELRLLLGVSLHLTRGYSSPSVRANYERARTLCENVGDEGQLFEIMHAVWYAQQVGSKLDAAQATVAELMRIAERQDAPEFRLRAALARGRTEFWRGNFAMASQVLTEFLEDVTKRPIEVRAQTYGVDPVVGAYGVSGLALWFLGHPDQARARARSGIAYGEESRQPHALASALLHATIVQLLCGNVDAVAGLAARTAKVCADSAIANFGPMSRFFAGAALAVRGDVESGLAEMRPSLVDHREVVGSHITDIMLGFMASAYGQAGQWEEGLRRADEGISLGEATLEQVYAAELWRVKGELLLGKAFRSKGRKRAEAGRMADVAEKCLRRALEIARQQEARSLALKAAMSLARLCVGGASHQDARELLRSLYASFTEGFDTKDLKEAKAILDVSAQRPSPAMR